MTGYSHADLSAAIDELLLYDQSEEVERHLDTLAAILELHPFESDYCCDVLDEPSCPTVRLVADALTRMGAL